MTGADARRVFGELMRKARVGTLTQRDRAQLTQARQILRRAKRPAMNARRKSSGGYRPPQEFHGTTHRGYSIQFNALRNEYWIEKDGAFIAYAQTISEAKKKIDSIFGDNPTGRGSRKRNPIDRGEFFWIVKTTTYPSRYLTREGLSPHHVQAHHFSSYEAARKMGQKFFKGTKTLWQIEQRDDEWARPTSPGKPRANPGRSLQRIGRAVEVRYRRDIGRKPGYYKHEIESPRAGVYTIPAGWVYVGSKSILITESKPRV